MKKLINLIINNKKIYDIVQIIYIQNKFSFTPNIYKKIKNKKDYLDLNYKINNFKARLKVAIKF